MICANRNCTNEFELTHSAQMYCCKYCKGNEHYMRKADRKNPNRKVLNVHDAYVKNVKKQEIKHFSAQWLEDLWNQRKEREAV